MIIYTGGTLGMAHNPDGTLMPFNFENILKEMPALAHLDVELTVISFQIPIDSSNMGIDHWNQLVQIIANNYGDYQGFVIIHGTDTMAYSASALSFLLEGLTKPVIFTGAQLPIGATRSDAGQNLIAATQIAATRSSTGPLIKEVCIYFDYLLLRGNRCKKVESAKFDAFESDNYPPLAEAGTSIEFNYNALYQPPTEVFKVHSMAPTAIVPIMLFPGFKEELLEYVLAAEGLRAIMLETFGSGNAPTSKRFTALIKSAIERKIIVYNVSQCSGGRVLQGRYETSKHLLDMGVASGGDITAEAALAKLQFLLSTTLSYDQIMKQLSIPIRGEMT